MKCIKKFSLSNDKLAGILTWIKTSNSQIIELIQIKIVLILNIKVKNCLTMSSPINHIIVIPIGPGGLNTQLRVQPN